MKNIYKQILLIYFRNATFVILSGIFIVGSIGASLLLKYRTLFLPYYTHEMIKSDRTAFLLVIGIWLLLSMGVLLKRQFGNFRASIFPGYRMNHIRVGSLVFGCFLLICFVWISSSPFFNWNHAVLFGSLLACLFFGVLVLVLGYLSIGTIIFCAYLCLMILSGYTTEFLALLRNPFDFNLAIVLANVLIIFFFLRRLLHLKEEDFEYPYLLSWKQSDLIKNQMKASDNIFSVMDPFKRLLGIKEKRMAIPKYPKTGNIVSRAIHWDCIEYKLSWKVFMLVVVVTPPYVYYLKNYLQPEDVLAKTYSNFFLLAISPVLIIICAKYAKMGLWGYDLLRPVNKGQFFKEKGVGLLIGLFFSWVAFCIYFAVLPNLFLDHAIFNTSRFWGYCSLTGSYAFAAMAGVIFLSCLIETKLVIVNGALLCFFSLLLFTFAQYLSVQMILCLIAICLIGGISLLKVSHRKWCEKEFD